MKSIGGIRAPGATPETDDAPLFGSPAEIVERLQALQAVGVDYVLASDPGGDLETLRAFAEEVMPQLRDPVAAQSCEAAELTA
jgi:alkanesulfonate monooxygenase SsuD/methylene tetrahydromethanopterin reductase-like flavin-dependent oxidoreductase (luciferase family)